MITIVINSSHRKKQITLQQVGFLRYMSQQPISIALAVPEDQAQQYQEYEEYLLLVPSKYTDLPSQRQWCIENIQSSYIMFMDDDLTFLKRNSLFKLEKCESSDIIDMMKQD